MTRNRVDTRTITPGRRALLWVFVAVVAVHTIFIAMWVGPSNPVRHMVGDERLRSYVMPLFEQNWRIFAPTPRRAAVTFEFRAAIVDPSTGEERVTEWVDAVEREDDLVRGDIAPSRMALAGRRVANTLVSVMDSMNEEQSKQIAASYLQTPVEELSERLSAIDSAGRAGADDIARYMRYDEIAVVFATYYASTIWDDEIAYVQYRTSIRYSPPFEQRHELTIDDSERTYDTYGWRATDAPDEDTVEMFRNYTGVPRGDQG